MSYYAGIDVSLEQSSVCVVDEQGEIVCEAKVLSEPEALVRFISELDVPLARIGLEAGPLSQWLHSGMVKAGLPVVLLETRHVKAALSAMIVKTDRRDARGIAQLLRMGWYRPVHCKSLPAQEVRALLAGRKLLQTKLLDVERSIRGLLRGFGLKMGEVEQRSLCSTGRGIDRGPCHAGASDQRHAGCPRGLARRIQLPSSRRVGDRQKGCRLPAADDGPRRRRLDRHHVQIGGRRSCSICQIQVCRRTFWPDAEEISVR